ncbi:DUF222 domain-containing protein [Microbacterium ulmi]|uniref:DUF222 domain-containing protein n=2 Tax=Microbacterium ulmi TaxID=179095 RepID=A0A7Y2PZ50_9MICO|nr:DUF222 domain-containing protein [Microbacterium ulmi]
MLAIFAAERYSRVDAMRREAVREAELRGLRGDVVERSVRLEIAAALRITERSAGMLLARAQALVERYADALESLGRGRMTERHAEILADGLDGIDPVLRERLTSAAVELAEAEPVGVFRRKLEHLIEDAQSATLAQRHAKAVATRRVAVETLADGMALLALYAPAVEVRAAFDRATAMAGALRQGDGEARTLDQLRADVLCDLLIDGTTSSHPKSARGVRASVVVTVPALSLLSDEAAMNREPARVEGVGPISIEKARELCGGSRDWMRVLTHPETGMVVSVGRTKYRPPADLRRLVKWRADRCLAPGCGIPADRCEIDHSRAWADGGETALQNLNPFCTGHHVVKGHGSWTVRQLPDSGGVMEWISPMGRRYLVEPERRVPVFRDTAPTAQTAAPPF